MSLKQKFSVLYKSKPRTGETELPEDVRRAKSIQQQILERPQTTVIGNPSNNLTNRDIVRNNDSESLSENKEAEYDGVGIEMNRSLSPMPNFAAAIELNIEKEPVLSPLPVVNSNSFSRISTSSSSSSSITTPISAPLLSPLSNAARKRGRVADGILDAIEQMNAQPPPTDYMPMLFMMMQQSQQQMQQQIQQSQQQMQQSQQQMQQSNNQMMLLIASLFQNTRQKQDEKE